MKKNGREDEEMNTLHELCEELLEYVDAGGEIIHGRKCRPGVHLYSECTCGLERVMNEIRMELEIKRMKG
jgi:hypothetical protein